MWENIVLKVKQKQKTKTKTKNKEMLYFSCLKRSQDSHLYCDLEGAELLFGKNANYGVSIYSL